MTADVLGGVSFLDVIRGMSREALVGSWTTLLGRLYLWSRHWDDHLRRYAGMHDELNRRRRAWAFGTPYRNRSLQSWICSYPN